MSDDVVLVRDEVLLVVETSSPESLTVEAGSLPQGDAVEPVNSETTLIREEVLTVVEAGDPERVIVEVGIPGPAGAPGIAEEDMPYAKRTDFVGDSVIYKGRAAPGAIDTDPVWQISRLTIGEGGDVVEEWASGSAAFNKVWDTRAALSYS